MSDGNSASAGGMGAGMDPLTLLEGPLKGIGDLLSGIGSYNAGRARAGALHQAALQSQMESGVQGDIALQQGDQTMARAAVIGAANGGGLTGSTLGIVSSLGEQAMFNARSAAYRGTTAAMADNYNAKVAKENATNALVGGVIGSVSSVAGGWAKSAFQAQSMQSLSQLRGLGGDSPYDYNLVG